MCAISLATPRGFFSHCASSTMTRSSFFTFDRSCSSGCARSVFVYPALTETGT